MKLMKKISAVLLSLCLLVPCFTMVADAADGRISFTDPDTAVGEYVEVKCVLRSTSGNMGEVEVELEYDEAYLRFDSGDGITADAEGELTCTGSAGSSEVAFVAKFQALQEGTTKVEVISAEIVDSNGASLTLDYGNSTVTIAEGDPSKIEDGESQVSSASDLQVDVNGVTYTLTDDFADADIPNGYSRTQRTLDGEERQMVENENGSVCLGYMKDAEGTGDFFLYNEENATFAPYAEIAISDTTSIIVLSDASEVSLPDNYQQAKLSLNEKEFPVWQNTDKEGIYVIYAVNSNGETGFYQYDSLEGTYQRFEPVAVEEEEAEADSSSSILGKVEEFVKAHLAMVIVAVGLAGVLGLLILIILAVKLHNRNAELDELYDEYGIDLEEEEAEPVKEKKEKESKKNRKQKKEEPEEDFEEDFEEADLEEDFEEDFEEADLEKDFEDFIESDVSGEEKQSEEFTGYTERMDFTIDDLDELLGEKSEKKPGHMEDDDTFKVDFIDLD